MAGLRAAHGGPPFEPHATVVGAVTLRRSAAIEALRAAAVAAVAPYTARVTGVARGDFFYQCVYLLLEPTPEVIQTSDHFCANFIEISLSLFSPCYLLPHAFNFLSVHSVST
ncbi:hypothetical protein ACQ4PT_041980 [Festuca glaucescens]